MNTVLKEEWAAFDLLLEYQLSVRAHLCSIIPIICHAEEKVKEKVSCKSRPV